MIEIKNFSWSQKKLWSLKVEPQVIDVSNFRWLLDYPIWATDYPNKIFDLKPIDVLNDIETYPIKKKRILNVDLSYPIFAIRWNDKYVILDGFHRLLKSIIDDRHSIEVKIVSPDMISSIAPEENSSSKSKENRDIKSITFDIYNSKL
jgi:disulfide oxidoreductase YuzD